MIERPILFSGPMVRAILEGKKTQTRRVCLGGEPAKAYTFERIRTDGFPRAVFHLTGKPPLIDVPYPSKRKKMRALWIPYAGVRCRYGIEGDRLWVRESIYSPHGEGVYYSADDALHPDANWAWKKKRLPSIHMPWGLRRITLEIVKVRVERLQEISAADAIAEGIARDPRTETGLVEINAFRELWDSINGKRGFGWSANPWVWVIEFRRIKP